MAYQRRPKPAPAVVGGVVATSSPHRPLADAVRSAARRFATGVTIVAVRSGERAHAVTANSFVTLSLEPPLIGVALMPQGRMRRFMADAPRFGVSVLGAHQQDYASFYSRPDRPEAPERVPLSATDALPDVLIVPQCLSYFACELQRVLSIGDHDLVIGSVIECRTAPKAEQAPLFFVDGAFKTYERLRGAVPVAEVAAMDAQR